MSAPLSAPTLAAPRLAALARLRAVTVHRGAVLALDRLTLDLPRGAVIALTGGNGAGKSTLIDLLAGLLTPDHGAVDWSEGRRPRPALVVQSRTGVEDLPLTVEDVVAMGRWPHRGLLGRLTTEDRAVRDEALTLLGLDHLRRRRLAELSGGQRQRALVARALAERAELLLLDEPSTGLDAESRAVIIDALRAEALRGATVVHATHDDAAVAAADARIHLDAGRLTSPPVAAQHAP